ncbi:MAG: GTP-binding protein [Alcaligenaceae bacterium]|nr:GTP-binding protein [Alcaligenaceae bacterium]
MSDQTGSISPQHTPVFLLTGFLGSGKTSLLSRLIHRPEFSDTAVIINEFGEVGLDHMLVDRSSDADIVLLDSGCLCCAMSGSLQHSLESLYYRRLRKEIPHFERIVIETSGLADPGAVINTIGGDPAIARRFRLAGVITTVDAIHGLDAIGAYREAAAQLAVADQIVLTKTDLLEDPAAAMDLRRELGTRNPHAEIQIGQALDAAGIRRLFTSAETRALEPASAHSGMRNPALGHIFKYGITAQTFHLRDPVSWPAYADWVHAMQRRHGASLLRAKGILRMEDGDFYAIHAVHHLFSPPLKLRRAVEGPQQGALVLITENLSREELEETVALLRG